MHRLVFALVGAFALSACTGGAIHTRSSLGDIQTLSLDARQRLILQGTYPHAVRTPQGDIEVQRRAVCSEPSPDAAAAVAASLAASGGTPATAGAASLRAALAVAQSESVASIGLRTQTIQLMRDAYFRACEGLLNGVVDEDDYGIILANADAITISLAAIEALSGGGRVAPPVAVSASAPGVSADGATVTAGPAVAPLLGTAPAAATISTQQAEAIRSIAHKIIDRSIAREQELMRQRQLNRR